MSSSSLAIFAHKGPEMAVPRHTTTSLLDSPPTVIPSMSLATTTPPQTPTSRRARLECKSLNFASVMTPTSPIRKALALPFFSRERKTSTQQPTIQQSSKRRLTGTSSPRFTDKKLLPPLPIIEGSEDKENASLPRSLSKRWQRRFSTVGRLPLEASNASQDRLHPPSTPVSASRPTSVHRPATPIARKVADRRAQAAAELVLSATAERPRKLHRTDSIESFFCAGLTASPPLPCESGFATTRMCEFTAQAKEEAVRQPLCTLAPPSPSYYWDPLPRQTVEPVSPSLRRCPSTHSLFVPEGVRLSTFSSAPTAASHQTGLDGCEPYKTAPPSPYPCLSRPTSGLDSHTWAVSRRSMDSEMSCISSSDSDSDLSCDASHADSSSNAELPSNSGHTACSWFFSPQSFITSPPTPPSTVRIKLRLVAPPSANGEDQEIELEDLVISNNSSVLDIKEALVDRLALGNLTPRSLDLSLHSPTSAPALGIDLGTEAGWVVRQLVDERCIYEHGAEEEDVLVVRILPNGEQGTSA